MSLAKSFGKKDAESVIDWIIFGDDQTWRFKLPNNDDIAF